MKEIIRKTIVHISLLAAAPCFILGAISCKRSETDAPDTETQAEEQKANAEKQSQIKKSIDDMAAKYNAVTDWRKGSRGYTIGVQNALVRTDNRPVLVLGPVEDVVRDSEKYTVYFGGFDVATLMGLYGHKRYAVVARIAEVRKVRISLRGDAPDLDYQDPEDVYIELAPYTPNLFIAKGTCLDLMPAGDDLPSFSLLDARISFVLECTPEQVERIMSRPAGSDKNREKD